MTRKSNDRGGGGAPLTNNPFGALKSLKRNLPQADVREAEPESAPAAVPLVSAPYRVAKTKKGNYPVFVEKRAKGKVVTVIRNVSGDRETLAALLKKKCGAGGRVEADTVEIQGDQKSAVERVLREVLG